MPDSPQSGKTFTILNVQGGTALDVDGSNNTNLIGYHAHDGNNQKWTLNQEGDGQWTFQNGQTQKFLGIAGPAENGVPLVVQDQPFGWDIWGEDSDPGTYRICVHGTNQYIDLSDFGNSRDGNPVTLWNKSEHTEKNQFWTFEPVY